jgi:hypothetical protein
MPQRESAPPIPPVAMVAMPTVMSAPPSAVKRIMVAISPVIANVASKVEAIAITPATRPVAIVAIAIAAGSFSPALVITIAVVAVPITTITTGKTIAAVSIEIAVASIALAVSAVTDIKVAIATITTITEVVIAIAIRSIEPARYVLTTSNIVAAERLAVSRETTFTAVTALLVAAHLQKITHLTFAGLASIRSKLLAAAVCAAGLSIKASAGVITATRSVAAQ